MRLDLSDYRHLTAVKFCACKNAYGGKQEDGDMTWNLIAYNTTYMLWWYRHPLAEPDEWTVNNARHCKIWVVGAVFRNKHELIHWVARSSLNCNSGWFVLNRRKSMMMWQNPFVTVITVHDRHMVSTSAWSEHAANDQARSDNSQSVMYMTSHEGTQVP